MSKKTPAVHYLGHDRSKGYPSRTRPDCNTMAKTPVTTTNPGEVTCGVCQTQIWHLRHDMRHSLKGYGRPAIGAAVALCAASRIRWVLWCLRPSWSKHDVEVWEVWGHFGSERDAMEAMDLAESTNHPCTQWQVLIEGRDPLKSA